MTYWLIAPSPKNNSWVSNHTFALNFVNPHWLVTAAGDFHFWFYCQHLSGFPCQSSMALSCPAGLRHPAEPAAPGSASAQEAEPLVWRLGLRSPVTGRLEGALSRGWTRFKTTVASNVVRCFLLSVRESSLYEGVRKCLIYTPQAELTPVRCWLIPRYIVSIGFRKFKFDVQIGLVWINSSFCVVFIAQTLQISACQQPTYHPKQIWQRNEQNIIISCRDGDLTLRCPFTPQTWTTYGAEPFA